MSKKIHHYFNTCPICGDITKCRCSNCKRIHTAHVCVLCKQEEETTTTAMMTNTTPNRAGDSDTAYLSHKPLPYDMVQFSLPFLMRKLGFNHLEAALRKVKAEGWNTFFDPLTKHHIVKKGTLPGKHHKKEESSITESNVFEDNTVVSPVQTICPNQDHVRFVRRNGEYEIPNKVFKDRDEDSTTTTASSDASDDHIQGEQELISEYMRKVGKFYSQRKKNFKI